MNARLTMFLRTLAIGCCVVAFTAVAQTDQQQRPDSQHESGQQRPADQHAGHAGQRQQPGQQSRPQPQQSGQQQNRAQQPQQRGAQQYEQHGQRSGQASHMQPQQGQQYQQHGQQGGQHGAQPQSQQRGQQGGQQYQQHGQQHGQQQYRSGSRPQQWGHAPAHRPSFNFRGNDRDVLRHYYSSRLSGIDRAHRPVFRMGGYLPYEDIGFMSPVPPGAWGSLPPIPYGYEAGYWDGYVVVYDPNTGYILYVSDLL